MCMSASVFPVRYRPCGQLKRQDEDDEDEEDEDPDGQGLTGGSQWWFRLKAMIPHAPALPRKPKGSL